MTDKQTPEQEREILLAAVIKEAEAASLEMLRCAYTFLVRVNH